MSGRRGDRPEDRLAAGRQRMERAWSELQQSVRREVGVVPRKRTWILPILAAAIGLTVGIGVRRKTRRSHDAGGT